MPCPPLPPIPTVGPVDAPTEATGATVGNAAEQAMCPDEEKPKCDMKFVRQVYYGGETKVCLYSERGNIFTFPQDKELPCMPVDLERCLVDTSFMGPKARGAYGGRK